MILVDQRGRGIKMQQQQIPTTLKKLWAHSCALQKIIVKNIDILHRQKSVKILTKIIFTTSAYFPFQFCTFVVLQSLVGRIGNLSNGDQLGKNNPDDAKERHDQPSDHHVPP